MTAELTLEKFQGPLDLLLQLIEQEKLQISEISLSKVTEQYFEHLKTLGEDCSEELADFLVIATKLVYLKSKYLLPYLYPEADEGPSLAEQLKLYKRYAEASKVVEQLWLGGNIAYGRVEPAPIPDSFVMPANATANVLRGSMTFLLQRLKPLAALPQAAIDHAVSVKQKIAAIYERLKEFKKMSFRDIVQGVENRTEVIVSFLALLELVKQEKISIHQTNAFEEMVIRRV